jgi:hypothetical protein
MSWEGIVKVQRPMYTTGSYELLYVYDEHRQHRTQFAANNPQMKRLFPNDELKTYWNVRWPRQGLPEFLEPAPDQDW